MKNAMRALLAALVLATATYFAVRAFYTAGFLTVDVSDGDGHGPDEGSAEWHDAVQRTIPWRSARAGTVTGVVGFLVVFRALRAPGKPRRTGSLED